MDSKYYYKFDHFLSLEKCNALNDGTMIGSMACMRCQYCTEFSTENKYIKCEKIKEATKQKK